MIRLGMMPAASPAPLVPSMPSAYMSSVAASPSMACMSRPRRAWPTSHASGVEQLIHVSGIGADPASSSPYIAARGRGEIAV
jgi:hypothetical protein